MYLQGFGQMYEYRNLCVDKYLLSNYNMNEKNRTISLFIRNECVCIVNSCLVCNNLYLCGDNLVFKLLQTTVYYEIYLFR